MTPQRIAAFCAGLTGGNPAGVVLGDTLPPAARMQDLARQIGYSETAFAAPDPGGGWRVRYFAPEIEVPFCGHATIALGAALGAAHGPAVYDLVLNDARITVEAYRPDGTWHAALNSPPAWAEPLDPVLIEKLLHLFGLSEVDLDPRLPPMLGWTGPRHPVLALRDRAQLAAMAYDFEAGRALMQAEDLTTIALVHIEGPRSFVARNAFAIGGVVEDPATGAAAAALAAALQAQHWDGLQDGGTFTIRQGDDMGVPSHLEVTVTGTLGAPVRVAGATRIIPPEEVSAP